MADLEVSVQVQGERLDVLALAQEHMDRNLRFETVGPSCRRCREEEDKSNAGEEFEAPPIHPNCDCRLVLDEEEESDSDAFPD